MRYLGITSMGHDASICLLDGDEVVFASHQERFSGIKNDGNATKDIISIADDYGYDRVVWYEKPATKAFRQILNGEVSRGVSTLGVSKHVRSLGISRPISYVGHHESHAAGGYYTSGFDDAVILVCDAIGEFDTLSVWRGVGSSMKKIHSQSYPHSLGLFYSAFTQRVGKKPNEEEYIMMGMAALGDPHRLIDEIMEEFVFIDSSSEFPVFRTKHNLHRGCKWWRPDLVSDQDLYDIAAAVQLITEEFLVTMCHKLRVISKNLVLSGGVALNCKANSVIAEECNFTGLWIMPNPGDAGSSMGAILAHTRKHISFPGAYLGREITGCDFDGALEALLRGDIIGLAHGRSEWGPRSLGHRSILADPRGDHVKDKVNAFKRREPFRPFAPMILEEFAHQYFDLPVTRSPYMQFTAYCKYPDKFPAICHYDGSSRVQTLSMKDCPTTYSFLRRFYEATGCPMLLNTSMNIKGKPLVDTREDAIEFSRETGITVY